MAGDFFGSAAPGDVRLEELLECCDREIKFRRRVYPRWVTEGKLNARKADEEILRMRAVRLALLKYRAALLAVNSKAGGIQSTGQWEDKANEYLEQLKREFPEPQS